MDDSLYGRIRYFLTRTLPGQYIHICLNIDMEKHLKVLLPNRQVTYIPHGICSPSKILTKPSYIKEHERFLICPINRNYDISVVEELLSSEVLHNFLERENIKLFIKRQLSYRGICSNIIKIDNELSQPEYDYMLQNAMAVILPYGKRFKYRCSGIFFECVSRNTPILATDLEAMRIYDGLVNIGYFNNAVEMIQQLDICVLRKQVFYNKEMFNPYNHWKKLLDAIVKKRV